jgi:hypothetical protein
VSDISKQQKRDVVVPEFAAFAMTDEELDRVFGGMTGAYICAGKQQSVVLQ